MKCFLFPAVQAQSAWTPARAGRHSRPLCVDLALHLQGGARRPFQVWVAITSSSTHRLRIGIKCASWYTGCQLEGKKQCEVLQKWTPPSEGDVGDGHSGRGLVIPLGWGRWAWKESPEKLPKKGTSPLGP